MKIIIALVLIFIISLLILKGGKIMKYKFILKSVWLYFTILIVITFISGIDSICEQEVLYILAWVTIVFSTIYTSYKTISLKEIEKMLFIDKLNQ